MAVENETQTQEIYGAELEKGSELLAVQIRQLGFNITDNQAQPILIALCSIAVSLKKLAEEANAATANMPIGEVKQK